MMPHGRKSSLGPAALHFLSRQLQTDCSESFERAAPSANYASPPARRKILNRTGGRGTHGSRRRTLQCVRARRIFPSEQRQRAATIGNITKTCDDSRLNLEWKQRSHPLSSAGAWKAAAQPGNSVQKVVSCASVSTRRRSSSLPQQMLGSKRFRRLSDLGARR